MPKDRLKVIKHIKIMILILINIWMMLDDNHYLIDEI